MHDVCEECYCLQLHSMTPLLITIPEYLETLALLNKYLQERQRFRKYRYGCVATNRMPL